ncbi:uncharacterized protein [Antedon mediterranea]|uniref:uncharacterized protein n=1 Tax=Antedon mediterranea TaxID=105859 RepID=UPI003AF5D6A2
MKASKVPPTVKPKPRRPKSESFNVSQNAPAKAKFEQLRRQSESNLNVDDKYGKIATFEYNYENQPLIDISPRPYTKRPPDVPKQPNKIKQIQYKLEKKAGWIFGESQLTTSGPTYTQQQEQDQFNSATKSPFPNVPTKQSEQLRGPTKPPSHGPTNLKQQDPEYLLSSTSSLSPMSTNLKQQEPDNVLSSTPSVSPGPTNLQQQEPEQFLGSTPSASFWSTNLQLNEPEQLLRSTTLPSHGSTNLQQKEPDQLLSPTPSLSPEPTNLKQQEPERLLSSTTSLNHQPTDLRHLDVSQLHSQTKSPNPRATTNWQQQQDQRQLSYPILPPRPNLHQQKLEQLHSPTQSANARAPKNLHQRESEQLLPLTPSPIRTPTTNWPKQQEPERLFSLNQQPSHESTNLRQLHSPTESPNPGTTTNWQQQQEQEQLYSPTQSADAIAPKNLHQRESEQLLPLTPSPIRKPTYWRKQQDPEQLLRLNQQASHEPTNLRQLNIGQLHSPTQSPNPGTTTNWQQQQEQEQLYSPTQSANVTTPIHLHQREPEQLLLSTPSLIRKPTNWRKRQELERLLNPDQSPSPEPTEHGSTRQTIMQQETYQVANIGDSLQKTIGTNQQDISPCEETPEHYPFTITCNISNRYDQVPTEERDPTCIKECEDLFIRVKWLHDYVKETREMYEQNKLNHAFFSVGEHKMFNHLDEIVEVLHTLKTHLEYTRKDIVELYKLLKTWLAERYFECFEWYYLNQDIRQNLLSFVKKSRPDCHMLFQRLSQSTRQEYSFTDLEERFKEPNNWFDTLAYHLQDLKEAKINCHGNAVSQLAHETQQLLVNTQHRLQEECKDRAERDVNHSSKIVEQIQFPKNEFGLIGEEASLILAEDYAKVHGIFLNVNMPKKSKYGKSAYPGNKVYLVVFEKFVLLTTAEETKRSKSTSYQLLECCNRNYVDFEQLPKKASPHPHTFVLYFYKLVGQTKTLCLTTKYVLAFTGDKVATDSEVKEWERAIVIPENGIYATWSRPMYSIRQQYTDRLTNVTFTFEDEVEVIEETEDEVMFRVQRLHDNKVGWIPREIGQQLENEYQIMVNIRSKERLERINVRERTSNKKKRVSVGIGVEEFSKRKTILGQRFGGVIAFKRRLLNREDTEVNLNKEKESSELATHKNKRQSIGATFDQRDSYDGNRQTEEVQQISDSQYQANNVEEGIYYDAPYAYVDIAPPLDAEAKIRPSSFEKEKKPDLPSRNNLETEADETYVDTRYGGIQKIARVFNEIVIYVRTCLEDLNELNSRYVTNAALDPQNGILQEGEYRRLFTRIPKLIKFFNDLLNDLNKCNRHNCYDICQLLLDVVANNYLKDFKDYTVNSRFQESTLSYLRQRRRSFFEIVKSQETPKDNLQRLLMKPCYFLEEFNLHIKSLQEAIEKYCNPDEKVVRWARDLVQHMTVIINECEEQDSKLQEKEHKHVSNILHQMEFEATEGVTLSEAEKLISNESWVESWNDVIVHSCKKKGGKDWKKLESNVKLVTFERVVMLINEKQYKKDRKICVKYKLIDCANKNFVEVEKPSSETYPFKVPKKKGLPMNVFLIVMHKDTCERMKYYICWESSQDRSFEFWWKTLSGLSGDVGEQYASWSRPKYKIAKHFLGSDRGELKVDAGDEVELTDKTSGWVRAVNLKDNKEGWIPNDCLGESIPSMFTRGLNLKQRVGIVNAGHTHHSVIVRKRKK